jgi:hypothetical protein
LPTPTRLTILVKRDMDLRVSGGTSMTKQSNHRSFEGP